MQKKGGFKPPFLLEYTYGRSQKINKRS